MSLESARRSGVHIWALVALIVAATTAATTAAPQPASAEYYSKLGYSSEDVDRYKAMAASIASCRTALDNDPHDMHSVDSRKAPELARLYGQCRKALESRRASIGVLRVNDTLLGLQCIAVGATSNIASVPACNLKPYLPDPNGRH